MTAVKSYQYALGNGDLVIVEVLDVKDPKYDGGIKFTYRCLSGKDNSTLFAVENSHGKPHVHRKEKREDVDCDWKQGLKIFREMLLEHMGKL